MTNFPLSGKRNSIGLGGCAVATFLVFAADINKNIQQVSIDYSDLLPFTDQLSNLKGKGLDLLLETPGGSGEVAEDLVKAMRGQYEDVAVIVPGYAKSAGTIMAMAADEILMGPHSGLGPIRLRLLLHEPITQDEAAALIDVLYHRHEMRSLIEWLEDEPVSWKGHGIRAADRDEAAQRQRREELRKLDADWEREMKLRKLAPLEPEEAREQEELLTSAKARYLAQASPCHFCGTPPGQLEWFHYLSPPSTWENLCGRAGWKTRCGFCFREVDFFIEILN